MPIALTDIAPGTRLRITAMASDSAYCAQLRRLGLVEGTHVTVIRHAPLGDPLEIRVRGYSLALRPAEAQAIDFELVT